MALNTKCHYRHDFLVPAINCCRRCEKVRREATELAGNDDKNNVPFLTKVSVIVGNCP